MTQNKLLKHLFSNLICFSVGGTPAHTTRKESSLHTLPPKRVDISSRRSRTDLCARVLRLGSTRILIQHCTRTISRCI